MDDERLRERIVLAIDALPVPPPPRPRAVFAVRPGGLGFRLPSLAVAAAVLVVVILVGAPLLVPSSRPAAPETKTATFSDGFSGGLDRTWNSWVGGEGPTVVATNGQVEFTIPANARSIGASGFVNAVLYLRCVARGDYEVSFDYRLLEWPIRNGTQLILSEFAPGAASVSRAQGGGGTFETYGVYDGPNAASVSTADASGSLRLVRRGTKVTGAFRSPDKVWVDLPVSMPSQFDATFQVMMMAGDREFGGERARVAIDSFRLTASEVICPIQ